MADTMRAIGENTISAVHLEPGLTLQTLTDIKNGKGDADSLFVAEVPKPKPKDTEALVKIKAFGLNRMDLLQREGNYPVPPQAPRILGVEFSGIIESFGKTPESGFNIDDEVFGLAYGGT